MQGGGRQPCWCIAGLWPGVALTAGRSMKDSQTSEPVKRRSHFGALGLGVLVLAGIIGMLRSSAVISRGHEMASLLGPLEGITLGLIVSSAALVLSTVGLLRKERPQWPGILGFALSVIPGATGFFIGIVVLVKLIAQIGE